MRSSFFIPLLLSGLCSPVQAADECVDPQDQLTLNSCAETAFKAADSKLNSQYKLIEERLIDDAELKSLLVKSQRSWISFRDAECKFQTSATNGASIFPMIYAQCMTSITRARVNDFNSYLNCEEEDMSCPVPLE
jgi:uncharacterized protein YecT (DUF1311 family)